MELLFQDKGDGGEFTLQGGDLAQDDTFYTAVYLSLFNGDCFYNIFTQYKSDGEFEELLSLPLTTATLKKVETAGHNALKWIIAEEIAKSVAVFAFGDIEEKINVEITITEPDRNLRNYSITWQNQKAVLRGV
jgi:phage gp46-like protein